MNPNCAALWKNKAGFEAQYGYNNPEQRAKGDAFRARIFGSQMEDAAWAAFRLAERAKLARVLTAGADVLLLDEPTNHLDVEAVEWLENFLLDFKGRAGLRGP